MEFCKDRLNIEFHNLCYYPSGKKGELIMCAIFAINVPVINRFHPLKPNGYDMYQLL
jgi:hypothetical protein